MTDGHPLHRAFAVLQRLAMLAAVSITPAAAETVIPETLLSAAAHPLPGFTAVQRGNGLSLHKENYLLPLTWSPDYQGHHSEVTFQLSIKQRLLVDKLYVAYTQKSMWQVLDREHSAPFRETNYNPEIFLRLLPGDDLLRKWHLDYWGFDLGLEHESNGQTLPASRSINRLYVAAFRPDGNTLWHFRAWYRLPEDPKSSPLDTRGDDNPLTDDYLGYGEVTYSHHFGAGWLVRAKVRGNTQTEKGALDLQFSKPSSDGDVFYVLSLFNGYGESLIDYDNSVTRVGFGLMFNR